MPYAEPPWSLVADIEDPCDMQKEEPVKSPKKAIPYTPLNSPEVAVTTEPCVRLMVESVMAPLNLSP